MNVFIIRQILIYMNCIHCKKPLKGLQTKFCSRVCKNRFSNSWHHTSKRQKEKGVDKKIQLILMMLGEIKCEMCNYNKNLSCLSFHHKDPSLKEFSLDQRSCSMLSMSRLTEEAKKCQVLCHNCHCELHHPQHNMKMVGPEGFEPPTKRL